VLSPAATLRIAEAIVREDTPYRRTVAAGLAAVGELRDRMAAGRLALAAKESEWLDRIEAQLAGLPLEEETLRGEVEARYAGVFAASSYGLEEPAV
jgi:hypothetical protein